MGWKIAHLETENIVRITAIGSITAEDAEPQVEQGVALIMQHQVGGVLADYSEAVLEMEITDILKVPELFEVHGLPRKTKIAVTLPSDPKNMHKYTFFDDLVTNRGYIVKLFWQPGEAQAWLRGEHARARNTEGQRR